MPPLLNDLVSLQKDTGLGVDRRRGGRGARRGDHRGRSLNYTPYIVAALLFVALTIPMTRFTDWVTARMDRRRQPGRRPYERHPSPRRSGAADGVRAQDLRRVRSCCGTSTWRSPRTRSTALIGASGSGKSTLLRCANLLEEIDDGAIWLDGEEITDPRVDQDAVRRRIGVVFQAYNLFPHMTVLENITLAPRRVHGVAARSAEAHARELLDRLGLARQGATSTRTGCRGGQQQRAAIVRALACAQAAAARRDHRAPWTPNWWARCSTSSAT